MILKSERVYHSIFEKELAEKFGIFQKTENQKYTTVLIYVLTKYIGDSEITKRIDYILDATEGN